MGSHLRLSGVGRPKMWDVQTHFMCRAKPQSFSQSPLYRVIRKYMTSFVNYKIKKVAGKHM